MCMAILFVHGITVRRERFEQLLRFVQQGVAGLRTDIQVHGCYWGDLASPLVFRGASVPGFQRGTRAPIDSASDVSPDWVDDPLAPFIALRDDEVLPVDGRGIFPLPGEVEERNGRLHSSLSPLVTTLHEAAPRFTGPGQELPEHVIQALVRSVLEAAARTDRRIPLSELRNLVEDALTAGMWLEASRGEDIFDTGFNWTVARSTVRVAAERELGGERAPGRVGQHSLSFAMRHGLRRHVMAALAIAIGDVLVHANHSQRILQRVHDVVVAIPADEPLTIVGHSLGGIIAFEYCRITDRPIQMLVTVGSQVGLFGELGVFDCLVDEKTSKLLPAIRTRRWLNLYDTDDILSFLVAPVFTGAVDREVNTRAPFPPAHSEYWNCAETYQYIVNGSMID